MDEAEQNLSPGKPEMPAFTSNFEQQRHYAHPGQFVKKKSGHFYARLGSEWID